MLAACWRERYPGGLTTTEEAFVKEIVTHAERRRHLRFSVAAGFALLIAVLWIIGRYWQAAVHERQRTAASQLFAMGQLMLARGDPAGVIRRAWSGSNSPRRRAGHFHTLQLPPITDKGLRHRPCGRCVSDLLAEDSRAGR